MFYFYFIAFVLNRHYLKFPDSAKLQHKVQWPQTPMLMDTAVVGDFLDAMELNKQEWNGMCFVCEFV